MQASNPYMAAFYAEDMSVALSEIEERYSGVSGKKDTILSVDESLNADYLAFREHVYPVIGKAGELTKAEYSGYEKIILRPNPSELSPAQLEFTIANRPAGILLNRENYAAYSSIAKLLEQQGALLYMERPGGILNARTR